MTAIRSRGAYLSDQGPPTKRFWPSLVTCLSLIAVLVSLTIKIERISINERPIYARNTCFKCHNGTMHRYRNPIIPKSMR